MQNVKHQGFIFFVRASLIPSFSTERLLHGLHSVRSDHNVGQGASAADWRQTLCRSLQPEASKRGRGWRSTWRAVEVVS